MTDEPPVAASPGPGAPEPEPFGPTLPGVTASAPPPSRSGLSWTASPAGKAGLILVLLLFMQIPLLMVSGLISEREGRENEVLTGFRRGWGPAQTVSGPVLAVPYLKEAPADKPIDTSRPRRGWIQIPASQLAVTATMEPETRRRGLFHAVVYTASLNFSGTITLPAIDTQEVASAELLWNEAVLVTAATDLRGQPADSTAEIDGHTVKQTIQATSAGPSCGTVFVPAGIDGPPVPGTTIPFRTSLVLRGTQSLNFFPYGRQTDLTVTGPWRSPGFTGATLPLIYAIDQTGFKATWRIAGDAVSGGWHPNATPAPLCLSNGPGVMGVDLLEAVPTYLMVSRAAKYGTFFLALSFLTYFLFEAVSRVRIHLAQYALLGLSVSLFALLLVALAEPLGFTAGYVLSTLAIMAQASLYTLSVVGSGRLGAMFAGMLGVLFGFLYVVVVMESFSLLAGTVALFGALSAIMFATRRLDWSAGGIAKVAP